MKIGKIEKNVPINRPTVNPYPFEDMLPGNSFVVSTENGVQMQGAYASQIVTYANKKYRDMRFASRRVNESSYRIWRIS